jgi:hypothetical protein
MLLCQCVSAAKPPRMEIDMTVLQAAPREQDRKRERDPILAAQPVAPSYLSPSLTDSRRVRKTPNREPPTFSKFSIPPSMPRQRPNRH